MQNIFYFSPFSFIPNHLCLPLSIQPLHSDLLMLVPEMAPKIHEKENLKKNFLLSCPGETTQREAESARSAVEYKSVAKPLKIAKNFYGKQQDDEYKLRPSTSNTVIYKKKNTESNIINQVFSYICTEKSKNQVGAFFVGEENRVNNFYTLMSRIKKNNKKYINRKFIRRLIDPQGDLLLQRALGKIRNCSIQINEVRKLLRVLIFRFLRDNANCTLLTSCKIYKNTLKEHFWRKRQILAFLFGGKNIEE